MSKENVVDEESTPTGYPSQKMIDDWHAKYPDSEIRGYPFPGLYIVYRSYTMSEQEELVNARAEKEKQVGRPLLETEIEQMMLERFVLWPVDISTRVANKSLPAGTPSVIASYIMVISGFVDLQPEIL